MAVQRIAEEHQGGQGKKRSVAMTDEQKIIYLLQYHDQLVRQLTANCFDGDEADKEQSAYIKEKLHKVNDLIDELLLTACMPF